LTAFSDRHNVDVKSYRTILERCVYFEAQNKIAELILIDKRLMTRLTDKKNAENLFLNNII